MQFEPLDQFILTRHACQLGRADHEVHAVFRVVLCDVLQLLFLGQFLQKTLVVARPFTDGQLSDLQLGFRQLPAHTSHCETFRLSLNSPLKALVPR